MFPCATAFWSSTQIRTILLWSRTILVDRATSFGRPLLSVVPIHFGPKNGQESPMRRGIRTKSPEHPIPLDPRFPRPNHYGGKITITAAFEDFLFCKKIVFSRIFSGSMTKSSSKEKRRRKKIALNFENVMQTCNVVNLKTNKLEWYDIDRVV